MLLSVLCIAYITRFGLGVKMGGLDLWVSQTNMVLPHYATFKTTPRGDHDTGAAPNSGLSHLGTGDF